MSHPKSLTLGTNLDAAIERVVAGERVTEAMVGDGELRAARFVAEAVPALLPTAGVRERALAKVRERVAAASHARVSWPWSVLGGLPRLRGVAIASVVLVGVLVGAAYATPIVLPTIFRFIDPPVAEILESGRAEELHLSQTVAGITITVDRAYADAQWIVVQFTVQNPPDDPDQPVKDGVRVRSPLFAHGVTLADDAGHRYRILRGAQDPVRRGHNVPYSGEPLVGVYRFDALAIPADAERVTLALTIAALAGVPEGVGRLVHVPEGPVARVPGPWTFTFTLPVSR